VRPQSPLKEIGQAARPHRDLDRLAVWTGSRSVPGSATLGEIFGLELVEVLELVFEPHPEHAAGPIQRRQDMDDMLNLAKRNVEPDVKRGEERVEVDRRLRIRFPFVTQKVDLCPIGDRHVAQGEATR